MECGEEKGLTCIDRRIALALLPWKHPSEFMLGIDSLFAFSGESRKQLRGKCRVVERTAAVVAHGFGD